MRPESRTEIMARKLWAEWDRRSQTDRERAMARAGWLTGLVHQLGAAIAEDNDDRRREASFSADAADRLTIPPATRLDRP